MENILPNALMIGVDYELFWTLTPKSIEPFFKAFRLRQEYEDAQSWSLGVYIRMAVASVMDKKAKYPKKPMMGNNQNGQSTEEMKANFMNHMELLNSRFNKENE